MNIWWIVLILFTIFILVRGIQVAIQNDKQPVITEKVRITKMTQMSSYPGLRASTCIVTFKLQSKGFFRWTAHNSWRHLKVGDRGILKYRGTRYISFKKDIPK